MAEATRNSSSAVKAARKKKIRQLEASLFGGGGGDGVTTGLPELQRVDEYNSHFNTADQRNKSAAAGSGLPALKRAPVDRGKKFFATAKNKLGLNAGARATSRSDEEELLESSEESVTTPEKNGPMPLPPSTAQAARRGSLGANILRSEVEQLDDSIKHLVKDPKREVLENLKRRHGVTKSPSMHDGIYTFPKQGSLTNVAAAAQAPLDRATLLERRRSLAQAPPESAGRRRATSLDRTSRLLEQEQADLERSMSKPERTGTTFSPQVDQGQKDFSWPSMPEIKAPAIAIGNRKDSLQPIGRSRSPRQAASPVSPTTTASVGFDGEKLGRAPKLPAIGAARVPDIKINTSHRPRRDPNKETQQAPAPGSLREPKSATHPPKASMVNFEGLERPVSGERGESLSDVENALEDVPTNTLDDMPKGMFDDIPTTVFDSIPTAVVERERKRSLLRTSKAAAAAAAGGAGGTNSRSASAAGAGGGAEQPLVATAPDTASPSAAADIFMSGRLESEVMTSAPAPGRQQVDVGSVSLITALFPNAGATMAAAAAAAARSSEERDQVDSDFVFAVFIQEQEQAAGAGGTTVLHVNP